MSPRFSIELTPLKGLTILQRKPFEDARGTFERIFCDEELQDAGLTSPIKQINRAVTRPRSTVRGLHLQVRPHADTRVVSCLSGAIFDVAVDLRSGSETFLQWFGVTLSEENHRSLLIPEGFAHGFQTLADDCEVLYLHTAAYAPDFEAGFDAMDPTLAIQWPEPVGLRSDRDLNLTTIPDEFEGIEP